MTLRPCPLCGGSGYQVHYEFSGTTRHWFRTACVVCYAEGSVWW